MSRSVSANREPSCVPDPEEPDVELFYKGSDLPSITGLALSPEGFLRHTGTMGESLLCNTILQA